MYFPSYLGNEQMSVHVLTMDHLNLDLLKSILLPDDRFSNFKMQIKAQNVSLYLVKDEFSSLTAFRWKITISETDAFSFVWSADDVTSYYRKTLMNPCSSGPLMTRTFSTDTNFLYFSLLLLNLLFNNNKLLVIIKIKTF